MKMHDVVPKLWKECMYVDTLLLALNHPANQDVEVFYDHLRVRDIQWMAHVIEGTGNQRFMAERLRVYKDAASVAFKMYVADLKGCDEADLVARHNLKDAFEYVCNRHFQAFKLEIRDQFLVVLNLFY